MKDPIIITGIPRSGRSMIAGVLNICGAYSGQVDKRFENTQLHNKVIKPYFWKHNADPEGQKNIVDTSNLMLPQNFRDRVMGIMHEQGYNDKDKWFIKSGQVSLMWPVWNYAFPNAKYIIIRRRIGDIVGSCMKTAYMDAYDDEEGWKQMCRAYESKFVEMIEAGLDCKVIWPHRMAHGDYGQIYELLDWLGLSWKTEILSWIDPKFWKMRKNK